MEIEVGEYVRTKMGTIGKFKYYGDDKENIYFKNDRGTTCVYEKEIVKHSKNIIDLIEEGDYVNGVKILEVRRTDKDTLLMTNYVPQDFIMGTKGCVNSIVTKEMFASAEYRVETD